MKFEKGSPHKKKEQQEFSDNLVVCPPVGSEPVKITSVQERALLADLPKWEIVETNSADGKTKRELHRAYKFESFELAFRFMEIAAKGIISDQNHHPRWENVYNRLNVWLTTHDLNDELSNRDECIARSLEALWEKLGKD